MLDLITNIYNMIKSFGKNEEAKFINCGSHNELEDESFIKPRPNFLKTIFDKK